MSSRITDTVIKILKKHNDNKYKIKQACGTHHAPGTILNTLTNLTQTPHFESSKSKENDCFILEYMGRD